MSHTRTGKRALVARATTRVEWASPIKREQSMRTTGSFFKPAADTRRDARTAIGAGVSKSAVFNRLTGKSVRSTFRDQQARSSVRSFGIASTVSRAKVGRHGVKSRTGSYD